ncbi:MAG: hypothetical protein FWF59_00270 [Turicibacter sp.]|nr:hypothetical protein [Turicibacter sp.]
MMFERGKKYEYDPELLVEHAKKTAMTAWACAVEAYVFGTDYEPCDVQVSGNGLGYVNHLMVNPRYCREIGA